MKQGYREQGTCQETGAKESGNGIRNGGWRRLEEGKLRVCLYNENGKTDRGWQQGWGKGEENVERS